MRKKNEIVIKMLRVEKVGAHATFWVKWAKAGPNRDSIDSSEKKIMFMDYQLTVLLVKVVCATFS